jgi:thioredoxin-like negative regulator of GroEL
MANQKGLGLPAGFVAVVAAVGLLLLAGCSKAGIVEKRCVADGEAREVCSCLAKTTEKAVDLRMYQVIVLGAEGKTDEAQALYNSLPPDLQVASSQAVRAAREQCRAKGPPAAPQRAASPLPAPPPPAS